MRLMMLLEKVKQWWRPENGTVSILDLIKARLLVKLSTGLTSILYPVEQVMSKIRLEAYVIQSQAKATIVRRTTEQIKPIDFEWKTPGCNSQGFQAVTVGAVPHYVVSGLTNIRPNTITFNQNNKPVLTITQDGDVEWTGNPSEAADAIMRVLQIRVEDKKGITKAARRRYYALACRNILEQAERMEYEEFLAYLNREVYNRNSKVIMDSLRGEEDAG